VVNPKFVAKQPQVPFDFAQGRLSTAIGAQNAPISAQDDSLFFAQDDNSHVIDPLGPDQSMSKI
jgi:hypothetical protein